jgi:hypothetical protein
MGSVDGLTPSQQYAVRNRGPGPTDSRKSRPENAKCDHEAWVHRLLSTHDICRSGIGTRSSMDAKQHSQLASQGQIAELAAQLAAISEVLRVIANSPDELQPICDTIVANAMRLCEAQLGDLGFFEGDAYRIVSLKALPNRITLAGRKGLCFLYSQTVRLPESWRQKRPSTSPMLGPMRLTSRATRFRNLGPKRCSNIFAHAAPQGR